MKHFYRDGLKFSCRRCSRCCRYDEGYVFLSRRDLQKIAKFFNINQEEVVEKYCRKVSLNGICRLSLKEKANKDCILWENGGCTVYKQRPLQCRSFPFWAHHLSDPETWNALEAECPGVNSGKVHTENEINRWLRKRRQEPFLDPEK
ncbi:MAG: YkgJ family cysteine cluster protein [Spirochaetia bacterium]